MLKKGFTNPNTIAVIGATNDHHKIGFSVLKNILDGGFKGQIFPVNPKGEDILGLKTYENILKVPTKIDLAVIIVPAAVVPKVLTESGKKNIKNVIIISAGFGESGDTGIILQEEIKKISALYGIDILGPNCLGYINPGNNLNISFATSMPNKKDIGVVSQSGATCTAILDWANQNGIGFSQFASLGNKIDLDENDFIRTLGSDEKTKVILTYLESITSGSELLETIKNISKEKPVVVLKAGKTKQGQTAAASHTGALAGDDVVVDIALKESGAIRANTLEEFFDFASLFSNLKAPKDEKVLIITNAGGPGVMTADALSESKNLHFYEFSTTASKELKSKMDFDCHISNPLDLLGDATSKRFSATFEQTKGKVLKLVIITPQVNTDINEIARKIVLYKDGLTVAVFAGGGKFDEARTILAKAQIPVFTFPERAVKALDVFVGYQNFKKEKPAKENFIKGYKRVAQKILESKSEFNDYEVSKILTAYNIPMAESFLTHNASEAVEAAEKVGYPVVLKITSPDILHKTEYGAIKLGIENEASLRESYQEVLKNARKNFPKANILGVTVYKMVRSKVEVALGAKRDETFGPVIMFGLGGIYIELLKDYSLGLAPVSLEKARTMIQSIRSYELLNGYRKGEHFDVEAIAQAISGLSQLMLDFPEINEIDINPLRVGLRHEGVMALDAKIILNKAATKESVGV